ncbi:hypothetical protein BDP81DRAFT_483905 [Colletotrichum phormii]|uniref:DUF7730 domain-containing protein n=1 Tax=Colletotrichum phormii TaxID=359342 RepID=A0AAI9ZKZ6_9PEZI|nr:uncharacterized protein BDP81DRAFT_483905 [Colletotrichum phormii]KAK1625206.1 hypothetical protein BDP81DRAFT_483905 [Colletotrichum phormii]
MHSATYAKGKRYGVLGYLPEQGSREAELWELNRNQSPLLRLPPEIRNKIYRLLLSNMGIHVLHDPKTGSFHCLALRAGANPWTCVPTTTSPTRHILEPERDTPKTKKKRSRPVLGRGLTLLVLVCRQLYHETELIPYRECAWSWATPGLMERYLLTERRMGIAQRRVLREVCVRGIQGFGNCSRRVRGVLGGLEVVWFWEVTGGSGSTGEGKWRERECGGWVCEIVERGRVEVGVGRPN